MDLPTFVIPTRFGELVDLLNHHARLLQCVVASLHVHVAGFVFLHQLHRLVQLPAQIAALQIQILDSLLILFERLVQLGHLAVQSLVVGLQIARSLRTVRERLAFPHFRSRNVRI